MFRLLTLITLFFLSSNSFAENNTNDLNIFYSNDLLGELEPCG